MDQVIIFVKVPINVFWEGLFEWPKQEGFEALMEELGIESDGSNLIVRRDMSLAGKNVCRVNGHIVTLANLRRVGSYLVDIQGQNEHQELLQPESHLVLLDRFGDSTFQQKKERTKKLIKRIVNLKEKYVRSNKTKKIMSNVLIC